MVAFSTLAFVGTIFAATAQAQTQPQRCNPIPRCPRDNGCTGIIPNGARFQVTCGVDFETSQILGISQDDNLRDCGHACSDIPGCKAFNMKDNFCYHLKDVGMARPGPNVIGSIMTKDKTNTVVPGASCGAKMDFDKGSADGCTYNTNGLTFVGRHFTDYYGNDIDYKVTEDLTACVVECAKVQGCRAVTFAKGGCWLKSAMGQGLYNVGRDGAYLLQR